MCIRARHTIDPAKNASLSIYKYDSTTASAEGAGDAESYVSTGLHDDAAVVDKLAKYAIQGVEFTYLLSLIHIFSQLFCNYL